MDPDMSKCVFEHMRSVKAQISLHIRTLWSGTWLYANRTIGHYRMYQWRANAHMWLCACMGWIWICKFCTCSKTYSRLPLSRIPRDSLKHFEISVLRHIRVERVRKTINWTTTFNKWIYNLTPEVRNIYIYKIMWKRGELAPISPLFHIILLPVVIVSC